MKIQIKSRWSGKILFETEAVSLRDAVIEAVKIGADLRGADLRDADLRDADLEGADLEGADLRGADLRGADLEGAYLEGAYLRDADLRGADLRDADLRDADLRDADLRDAYLQGADLQGADLEGADLQGADLTPIRDDLWAVLSAAPAEVQGLRQALAEGRIDGSTYDGECACLVGTIANLRQCGIHDLGPLMPNSFRPAERFFLAIRLGDTPDKSLPARIALEWVDEFLTNMKAAFGGPLPGQPSLDEALNSGDGVYRP